VRDITTACSELGLQQLTLYAFSMENWKRPKTETSFLMDLLVKFLRREQATFRKNNIRFKAIGRLHMLPEKVRLEVNKNIQETSENTGMILCLALSYGGRSEIADAAKQIAMETRSGKLNPDCIDEKFFEKYLYTSGMGDPDLLIRTAGELRVSNFLLWQISYSEFYVSDVCWPDFSREELLKAIEAYNRRERKFGGLNQDDK
jgi:undecaprenyl diphosphate synthase